MRIALAVCSFVLALVAFGISSRVATLWSSTQLGAQLARIAGGVFGGSLLAIGVILLSAALFGRVYCAVMCPLGILQDGIQWITRKKCAPQPNLMSMRYTVAVGAFAGLFIAVSWVTYSGLVVLWGNIEPYSVFGSIAGGTFNPLYTRLNNLLTSAPIPVQPDWLIALVPACAFLAVLTLLTLWRPRFFCTALCPVGTVLGLCSKFSPVAVRMMDTCVGCGQCAKVCPTGCIDVEARTVDQERCVRCMNCLPACRFNAIDFGLAAKKTSPRKLPPLTEEQEDLTRRDMLKHTFAATGAFALGVGATFTRRLDNPQELILPPGAGSWERFKRACTGCQLCVTHCVGNVLRPAGTRGMVHLKFDKGMCEFNCTACTDVCPTGALPRLGKKEKKLRRIGLAEFTLSVCVTYTDGTACAACAEHCPTGALQMVARENGVASPVVNGELCIGCGSCEYACPTRPIRAIVVKAVAEQDIATDPDEFFKPVNPPEPSATTEWAF